MSLEELDIICHKNSRLKEEVELIKDYIKKARMDFGDLIDIDHIASFTGREKHELEQIFTLGSKHGLFEVTPVYYCNGHSIGELGGAIPPFEIFCDVCREEHIFREENIKNCYKIMFKSQLQGKEKLKKPVITDDEETNIDFGIITALRVELESVLEQLNSYNKKTKGARTYFIGKVDCNSKIYNIVVSKSPNAGSNDSAALTSDLIHEFDPDYIVKIGIAGGHKGEVELGDVVCSNQIFVYDYTKEYDEVSKIRVEGYRSSALLTNLADSYLWDGKVDSGKFKVSKYTSPIATGNKVIRTGKAWKNIKEIHDKIIAIEMEGGGIATVAHNQKDPKGVLIISGISDYGDCKKNDNWHERASKNAAQFFFDFMKNNEIT